MTLAALFLVAILGLASLMVWQNYKAALTAGETRAESSAHVVAAHIEWMIEASDQALRRVDAALGDAPIRASTDITADISQAVGDLPAGFQYSVFDETGRLRLSSVAHAGSIDISDREYFHQLMAGTPIVVTPQLDERLSRQPAFVIARRISRNGQFHGAASIAIPTAKMDQYWSSMGLGPNSTISLLRDDGWLVARHPQLDRPLDLSTSPLFTRYLPKSPHGFYHSAVSPADGLSRIVGYWKVDGWPLVAATGVERGEALEMFWSGLTSEFAFGLPVMMLLVAASIWIARLLQAYAARNLALEMAIERNTFLMREIHHRVKNNLQAVSALVRLQPLPPATRLEMDRRIAAMIAVHEQIYQSDQFDRVEVAPYTQKLVREIAAAYQHAVTIETQLEPLTVTPDDALPIGMVINEVVSNAFKYAFNDRAGGVLKIALVREDNGHIQLIIRDDGPGMAADRNTKGMGSRLIAGFVSQLGGQFSVTNDDGTIFTMSFPPR